MLDASHNKIRQLSLTQREFIPENVDGFGLQKKINQEPTLLNIYGLFA